jgi:hypothetical protein
MASSTTKENLVSVKEMDYLDQDPPLRGQNYVCLSFVSPEDVIKKKEAYFFEEFVKNFATDMREWFVNMEAKYPTESDTIKGLKERYSYIFDGDRINDEYQFYLNSNSERLEDEYFKRNDYQTSIRGLKVRGVFDSLREAEIRAQVLKKIDDKFNVYVAQVGCWCPWSPNPDDISDQEYAESHLNTMMKKYKENQDKRDAFYMERKRDMQFASTSSTADSKKEEQESEKTKESLQDEDPWMANKKSESVVDSEPNALETTVESADATVASTDAPSDAPAPSEAPPTESQTGEEATV